MSRGDLERTTTVNVRRLLIGLIALGAAAVLASVLWADLASGTKAPDFTLPTLDGKTFTLHDSFKKPAKVVVLDLWATWCPPCRAQTPHLIALNNKFKDKGVLMVGVAIDAERKPVTDYAKKQGVNYTVVLDPEAKKTGASYKIRGIPATYVIDKKGIIRFAHSGFPPDRYKEEQKKEIAKFESELRQLIAEK